MPWYINATFGGIEKEVGRYESLGEADMYGYSIGTLFSRGFQKEIVIIEISNADGSRWSERHYSRGCIIKSNVNLGDKE